MATQLQVSNRNGIATNITASDAQANTFNISLPPNKGAAGNVLTTDGQGVLNWAASGGGTVTDGNYGAITVSGGGSTWAINNSAVELADIVDIPASTILGRTDAGAGAPQALTLGSGLSIAGTVISSSATGAPVYLTGPVLSVNTILVIDHIYPVLGTLSPITLTLPLITLPLNGRQIVVKKIPGSLDVSINHNAADRFDYLVTATTETITSEAGSVTFIAISKDAPENTGYTTSIWIRA